MVRTCPYCNRTGGFDNSNISHKYRHSCNNYLKVCPICQTIYSTANDFSLYNCKVVENIFDVDYCLECKRAWLPDFPTSWTRSFTNLNKIYEFIQDIYANEQKNINADNLLNIQRSHFGVVYNPLRAKMRGIEEYIVGAGRRRMLEYLNVLRNMSILKIKEKSGRTINHEFTKFGEEIASTNDTKELLTYFINAYVNIKVNNGFQKKQKNSCYSYFKIRYTHNLLRVINYINNRGEGASEYQIGLSFLTRDEEQFRIHCIGHINTYSSNQLKNLFFKDETELIRAVTSTFLNVFETMSMIKYDGSRYYLTELGNSVLKIIDSKPAIWYEDIVNYCNKTGEVINDTFAKLILWRLLKNKLLSEKDINISVSSLNNLIIEITKAPINQITDIHINLHYDEPMENAITDKIIKIISSYLINKESVTLIELDHLCSLLSYAWFDEFYQAVDNEGSSILELFVNSTDNLIKKNMQSGSEWHEKVKKFFNDIGLETVNYRDMPIYEHIIIERLNLMLPGGTVYNPDLLILERGYGTNDSILVDAKDQNSINSEIPKLIGYNIYSKDPNVDSFTIIALRGKLPNITKQRIIDNVSEFDRITIIEEEALEKLSSKARDKESVLNMLTPQKGFKHIAIEDI